MKKKKTEKAPARMYTLDEMLEEIRPKSPKVLISFSRGKDAWGVWCALRDKIDFELFHYYGGPPDLEFVNNYLEYAEKKTGKKIWNYPAPTAFDRLSKEQMDAQNTWRNPILVSLDIQTFTFADVQEWAMTDAGLPVDTTWVALGVRAKDSARRGLFFKSHGNMTFSKRKFYPVWDWDKDKLITELKRHDVKLPIDYKLFGRTFDGIYHAFL